LTVPRPLTLLELAFYSRFCFYETTDPLIGVFCGVVRRCEDCKIGTQFNLFVVCVANRAVGREKQPLVPVAQVYDPWVFHALFSGPIFSREVLCEPLHLAETGT
jgi:hypothetical protein